MVGPKIAIGFGQKEVQGPLGPKEQKRYKPSEQRREDIKEERSVVVIPLIKFIEKEKRQQIKEAIDKGQYWATKGFICNQITPELIFVLMVMIHGEEMKK